MYKSESEINKVYRDHLESLIAYGEPFDELGLHDDWTEAIKQFRENQNLTYDEL